jgi:peptidoglycan hydrolase-like protein with peptidoglycan-binding domain
VKHHRLKCFALVLIIFFIVAAHPTFAAITKNIGFGSSGPNVIELQNFLKKYNYFPGSPNGYFGNMTRTAVKKF